MGKRAIQVLLGGIFGLMVALVYTFRDVIPDLGPGPGAAPAVSSLVADPFPAPPLSLLDTDGGRVELEDLRGSVVALFFGYTNCPDVCPITIARLARFQEAMGPAPVPLRVVFVSIDPERDTPERLRLFARGLPGEVLALYESEDEVRRQAFEWGVLVREQAESPLLDGGYLVDHTARTFVVDPEGRVVATLQPMPETSEIDRTLEEVLGALR